MKESEHHPRTTIDAITLAIQEEVTRDTSIGQGNDLSFPDGYGFDCAVPLLLDDQFLLKNPGGVPAERSHLLA